eukprot:SAG31_NODE_3454_length_4253_cov_2.613866_1_plen_59_part_10
MHRGHHHFVLLVRHACRHFHLQKHHSEEFPDTRVNGAARQRIDEASSGASGEPAPDGGL